RAGTAPRSWPTTRRWPRRAHEGFRPRFPPQSATTPAPTPPSSRSGRRLGPDLDLQRLGQVRRDVGARTEPYFLTLGGEHHAGASAATDRRALRGTASASGNGAYRRTDAGANPDLLRVVFLGRLGLQRDRSGLDLVTLVAGTQCIE